MPLDIKDFKAACPHVLGRRHTISSLGISAGPECVSLIVKKLVEGNHRPNSGNMGILKDLRPKSQALP
jgi:hypothetical protein